ncbi:MAG TPA: hypothetical protein VGI47_11490 [Candidatus Binataceae bacterium]
MSANAEFLAFALGPTGLLQALGPAASEERIERCLGSLLIYSIYQFAREEFSNNESELISLLARLTGSSTRAVMVRRDMLRKTPHSEEWVACAWILSDLGQSSPTVSPELERGFAYQYLSYIAQYRRILASYLGRAH